MNTRARLLLKSIVERSPEPLGPLLAHVPFRLRLGRTYERARADLLALEAASEQEQRARVLERTRRIVQLAAQDVPFYREHWRDHGFDPATLRTFEDIARIPVVTKQDMKRFGIEDRTRANPDNMHLNTGGTSGQPLDFYIDGAAFAREWAHMHRIWARVGYRPTDVKLTLRGKHLGGDVYRYNAVHNEFLLNGYVPLRDVLDAVRAIAKRRNIAYIHGYPSAIAELARGCTELAPDVATTLRRTLRGVLLGSEYPAPVYRDRIEQAFGAPTISWYGHSEMAILAGEVDRFLYAPMLSYGLTEAVPDGRGGHRLVGTSYDNVASPFIRYDTGDSIEPVEVRGGILRTFRIASGRVGEYVTDKTGGHVSLTALIFGRHHPIFDTADFLQVRQTSPGAVEILVTPSPGARVTSDDVRAGFDATHVALDIRYTVCQEPIRTPAGKVPLLVR